MPTINGLQVFGGDLPDIPLWMNAPVRSGVKSFSLLIRRDIGKALAVVVKTVAQGDAAATLAVVKPPEEKVPQDAQRAMNEIDGLWYYLNLRRCPMSVKSSYDGKEPGVVRFTFRQHEGRTGSGTFDYRSRIVTVYFDDKAVSMGYLVPDTTGKGNHKIEFFTNPPHDAFVGRVANE